MKQLEYLSAAALLCIASAAFGQEQADENQSEAIEEIVILGHPLSAEGLATPAPDRTIEAGLRVRFQ